MFKIIVNAATPIVVVGSINMDLVIRCDQLPRPGESRIADSSAEICGGKGANQAVACARSGGAVSMVGRVGDDSFGEQLKNNLLHEGIDCDHVTASQSCPSGLALVAVEHSGQNAILAVPGANGKVTPADVEAATEVIQQSEILLLQLEIPTDSVLAAIEIAKRHKIRIVLDPAPVSSSLAKELLDVDLICPNETEASTITGLPVESVDQGRAAAHRLHEMGARRIALTMGNKGTLFFDGRSEQLVDPFSVHVVDTTAAGDAFAGALAVQWARSDDVIAAIGFGNAAGAFACSKHGAQPSMGTSAEIDALRFKS